jgi:hypothetical protein
MSQKRLINRKNVSYKCAIIWYPFAWAFFNFSERSESMHLSVELDGVACLCRLDSKRRRRGRDRRKGISWPPARPSVVNPTWSKMIICIVFIQASVLVDTQEAKYVESWPNMTSAWAGWSKFDIPVDSQLICTSITLGSSTCH